MAQTELLYFSEKYRINLHPKLLYFLKWHHHHLPVCSGPKCGNSIFLSSPHTFHPIHYSALNLSGMQLTISFAAALLQANCWLGSQPASKHSSHPQAAQQGRDLSAVLSDITSFPINPFNGFLRTKHKCLAIALRPCIFWTPFLSVTQLIPLITYTPVHWPSSCSSKCQAHLLLGPLWFIFLLPEALPQIMEGLPHPNHSELNSAIPDHYPNSALWDNFSDTNADPPHSPISATVLHWIFFVARVHQKQSFLLVSFPYIFT